MPKRKKHTNKKVEEAIQNAEGKGWRFKDS